MLFSLSFRCLFRFNFDATSCNYDKIRRQNAPANDKWSLCLKPAQYFKFRILFLLNCINRADNNESSFKIKKYPVSFWFLLVV